MHTDSPQEILARKADDGADIATQAASLQDELDKALLDALVECERQSSRLRDIYDDQSPLSDDDLQDIITRGFARIEADQDAIGEAIGDIIALKKRIRQREREINEATDETRRTLLESLRLSDLLEKNLLILKTLVQAREALGVIERLIRRLTTI